MSGWMSPEDNIRGQQMEAHPNNAGAGTHHGFIHICRCHPRSFLSRPIFVAAQIFTSLITLAQLSALYRWRFTCTLRSRWMWRTAFTVAGYSVEEEGGREEEGVLGGLGGWLPEQSPHKRALYHTLQQVCAANTAPQISALSTIAPVPSQLEAGAASTVVAAGHCARNKAAPPCKSRQGCLRQA